MVTLLLWRTMVTWKSALAGVGNSVGVLRVSETSVEMPDMESTMPPPVDEMHSSDSEQPPNMNVVTVKASRLNM